MATPNQYHLHGGDLVVTYYPFGNGPINAQNGAFCLGYQRGGVHKSFGTKQVRTVVVADVGTIVSATLTESVIGETTFSLIVPSVTVDPPATTAVRAEAITTVDTHGLVAPPPAAQHETYTVTPLSGTAAEGILAD